MLRALLLVFFALSTPAMAGMKDLDKAFAYTATLKKTELDLNDRLEIAEASIAYWDAFEAALTASSNRPRPPEPEQDDSNVANLESPKFALNRLRILSRSCSLVYGKIAEVIGRDVKTELYLWLHALDCYRRSDLTEKWIKLGDIRDEAGELVTTLHFEAIREAIIKRVSTSAFSGR